VLTAISKTSTNVLGIAPSGEPRETRTYKGLRDRNAAASRGKNRTITQVSEELNRSNIFVPGQFLIRTSLGPAETKEFIIQIPPEFDFLLHDIVFKAEPAPDGPIELRIKVTQGEQPASVQPQTVEEFVFALDEELPRHQADWLGQTLDQFETKNEELRQRVMKTGDDEAFFELLGRDPRVIRAPMTLAKLVNWRLEVERYLRCFRIKTGDLFVLNGLAEAKKRMQAAKNNLSRFGKVHADFYDQRGKNILPRAGVVKGLYYAFLCLIGGIRREYELKQTELGERQARRWILAFVDSLKSAGKDSQSFFVYVAWATRLLKISIAGVPGSTPGNLASVVGCYSDKPSDLALQLTAQAFDVSVNTVERLKKTDCVVIWSLSSEEVRGVAGRPIYQLENFPEYQLAKERIAPLK
jgi:hypothetical protein